MTDSTDDVDWYEPEDELSLKETELLEKYERYKDSYFVIYKYGQEHVSFSLREIIQLAKLVNEDL